MGLFCYFKEHKIEQNDILVGDLPEILFLPVFIPVLTKENINVSFAKLISLVRPRMFIRNN
jgi:hypothetical protein